MQDNNTVIKKMIEDGFAIKRIASLLQMNEKEVKEIIENYNYSLIKEDFSNEKINYICDLYASGVSAKILGMKFSIDKRRVQKWAKERDMFRDKSQSHRFTDFNQNIFDSIDNEEKAYWLGFFYADAYNSNAANTVSLSLQISDYDHLKKLAKFVGLPEDKIFYTKTKQNYEYYTLKMYSKHLCETLNNLGCPQGKSFVIKYPEWLDSNLNIAFIRGLFDGDGSLAHRSNNEWKWSLATTKECAESIKNIISKELDLNINISYISKTEKNTYELETNGNEKVLKLAQWLYDNSSEETRLDRKYERMLQLIEQQGSRTFKRKEYKISEENKHEIIKEIKNGVSIIDIAKAHDIHPRTVSKIKSEPSYLYDQIPIINGKPITAKYVKSLTREDRFNLIEPLFKHFREMGWQYPNNLSEINKSWTKLLNYNPDLSKNELYNNDSLATDICKHFCKKFYDATEYNYPTMKDIFHDDNKLRKLIQNRLGLDWKDPDNTETFNISFRMLIQGMRSSRVVPSISIFKPSIAKYLYMKYSNEGDTVFDYSAGWGGRMLGAASCNRKYIGADPWTTDELSEMVNYLNLNNVTLINNGSENVKLQENSVDFSFSSPPYYSQEVYSLDDRQAYAKGEDHFYNVYWKQTLENIKYMLKPKKYFGLNVKNYPKMVEMAQDVFGNIVEEVNLRTVRSHLNKNAGIIKNESVYIFINEK